MLLGIIYQAMTSYYVWLILMRRISNFSRNLLVFGILLIFLGGFNDGNVPPIGYWGRYGQYILLIGGAMSILMAVVLMLVERKQLGP